MRQNWAGLWWVLLWLLSACAAATPAASPAADDSLAGRVTARILTLAPDAKVERVAPNHLRVTNGERHDEVYLDNLRRGCENAPRGCEERIELFARMTVSPPNQAARIEAILPTLKSQAFVDEVERAVAARGQQAGLLVFPVVDDLRLVLVLDTPAATRMLTEKDLVALGVDRETARVRALDNLRARARGFKVTEPAPQVYALAANDAYDSAMFLLHPEWQDLIQRLGGAPVVVPVGRDIVLFASESSATGLNTLSAIVTVERREPAAAYPITTQAYRWTPAGWVAFELPPPR